MTCSSPLAAAADGAVGGKRRRVGALLFGGGGGVGQYAFTVHTKISPILIWADFFLSEMFGFSAQNDSPPGFFAAISPASFCKT